MSAQAVSYYHNPVTADVMTGGQWTPSDLRATAATSAGSQELLLRIEVPEFDLFFVTALNNIQTNEDYSTVDIEALIDPGVSVLLTLKNQTVDAAGHLQIKEVSINFDVVEHTPRAHFIAASLYAMLSLAGPINVVIPNLKVDVSANFSIPLGEISKLLQGRQTYYGLMVIERATGLQFDIPEQIHGDDMTAISFTYHAIVKRSFDWLANYVEVKLPANERFLAWARDPRSMQANEFSFGPTPAFRTIFGQTLALGPETVTVPDGVIQNVEMVRRELASLDGHLVPVVVRPLSGIGRYELPLAPQLPMANWDEKIEACIKFEGQLNERLAARYNELAASTLAGLTAEEIEVVTERPLWGEAVDSSSD